MRNMIGAAVISSVVVGGLGYLFFEQRLRDLERMDEHRGPNPRQTVVTLFTQNGNCVAKFDDDRIGNKHNKHVSWWIENRGCNSTGEWWVELEFDSGGEYPFDQAVVRSFGPHHRVLEKIKNGVTPDCYPFTTFLVAGGKRIQLGDPEIEVEPPSRGLGGGRCRR